MRRSSMILVLTLWSSVIAAQPATDGTSASMPPVVDAKNLYSETAPGKLSPAVANALTRVYVPNRQSNDVYVIDPATMKVVDKFPVGRNPQHVVPSWDLKTLWVANNAEGRTDGTLTPIDPVTGKPGKSIAVDDPYNMYFSPDGRFAIVVAEARKRLDFRNAQTMKMEGSLPVPECGGVNHADFSIDGRYAIFTCEFSGQIGQGRHGQSQSHRLSEVDARRNAAGHPDLARRKTFLRGRHARRRRARDRRRQICGSRVHQDRGRHAWRVSEPRRHQAVRREPRLAQGLWSTRRQSEGSVSVIDFATRKVETTWPIPGGGSPDMGNVSADGKTLWLSGRFDDVVYAIDTATGDVKKIPVGKEPHGLTVWPQPGRYSLGHTGNLR